MDLNEFDAKYGSSGQNFAHTVQAAYERLSQRRKLLSSGLITLDLAHGIGGIYTGALIRIMGSEGTGKSSLSYRILADGMSQGMSGLIIDTEGKLNLPILESSLIAQGLPGGDMTVGQSAFPLRIITAPNMREVTKSKPFMTAERMFPVIEEWVKSDEISPDGAVVIIDSLDFLTTEDQVSKAVEANTVALIARQMKNWLRRFMGTVRGTGSLIIVISQVSANIHPAARDQEVFSGGNGVKHASSFSLRLKDIGQMLEGNELVGRKVQATITKSSQGRAWRRFEYVVRWDTGPDNYSAIIELAKRLGVLADKIWMNIPLPGGGTQKVQGAGAARQFLIERPDVYHLVENLVLQAAQGASVAESVPEAEQVDVETDELTNISLE